MQKGHWLEGSWWVLSLKSMTCREIKLVLHAEGLTIHKVPDRGAPSPAEISDFWIEVTFHSREWKSFRVSVIAWRFKKPQCSNLMIKSVNSTVGEGWLFTVFNIFFSTSHSSISLDWKTYSLWHRLDSAIWENGVEEEILGYFCFVTFRVIVSGCKNTTKQVGSITSSWWHYFTPFVQILKKTKK